jgi:pimeloyl-ACP methyl ester carboxylesterase
VDYFKFTLSAESDVAVSLSNIPSGCDYDLELYTSGHTRLAWSLRAGNASEDIAKTLAAGAYYIKVYAYSGMSGSAYRLQVTSTVVEKTTLVLIAGIMGNRLYNGNERIWDPPLDGLPDITKAIRFGTIYKPYLMSDEDGDPAPLSTEGAGSEYGAMNKYQSIYQFLDNDLNFPKSDYNFKFFTYDWRYSSKESADCLADFIANDSKVILIAHSMGGLVASAYLDKGVTFRNKVEKMITLGTPYTGAVKAIVGFEFGDITGTLADLILAPHMKEICANTTSVYELLPTSRYGSSYVNIPDEVYTSNSIPVDLTHSQARDFFAENRPWAIKSDGTPKQMLAKSEAFHSDLMSGSSHVADYVDTYYIVGSGSSTPAKAFYENLFSNDPYFLSYSEMGLGDGTVLESSAANRHSNYEPFPVGHLELVEDEGVHEHIKDIILGTSSQALSNASIWSSAPTEFVPDWESSGNYISIVLQGVDGFSLYDDTGNELIQDGDKLYVQNADGTRTKRGSVWLVNFETMRRQYVLAPGTYTFENMETDSSILTDALFMRFENWMYMAKMRYSDFADLNNVTLSVSTENCEMIEDETLEEIIPISVSSTQELYELNKDK